MFHIILRRFFYAFLFMTCLGLNATKPGARPNILFIYSDDHRYDQIGAINPDIHTPNLDRLVDSGVNFSNAYVTTAICSPSRAACLTGMYGSRNGVATLTQPLRFPWATFVHDLAATGYRTAQVGKWHLGTSPVEAGFEWYAAIEGNGSWFQRKIESNIPGVPNKLDGRFYETVMADTVIDWMADHSANHDDNPFMVWWCTQVPHVDGLLKYPDVKVNEKDKTENVPWGSVGGYRSGYAVSDMDVPQNWSDDLASKPPYLASSRFVTKSVDEDYGGPGGYTNPDPGVRNATLGEDNVQQHMLEAYASVTALDAEIGRVLDHLEDPNGDGDAADSILDNTWIIFMGDNGWQTGHHTFTSKVLAYEESSRVPLIVVAPGVAARSEAKLALNIDLTAMFYDIAGLPIPEHMQGMDLRELIEDPATDWRNSFYYEAIIPEPSLGAMPHEAIRTERYKLILTYDFATVDTGIVEPIFKELYDLKKDPIEVINLINDPEYIHTIQGLMKLLEEKKAAVAASPDPA